MNVLQLLEQTLLLQPDTRMETRWVTAGPDMYYYSSVDPGMMG